MRAKKKFLILSGEKVWILTFWEIQIKIKKKYRNITFDLDFFFLKNFLVALISYQNSGYLFKFILSKYL